MRRTKQVMATACLMLLPIVSQSAPIFRTDHIFRPLEAKNGMVVAAEGYAAAAGLEILKKGGNAVDAGVCVGFTLAVTLPRAGNIGGGGFMLIHDASTGQTHALDYREMAPMAASRNMFLDENGNPVSDLSQRSPLAVGVPGTVAGLIEAHQKFGSLPLVDLLAPAIQVAREGFEVDKGLAKLLVKAVEADRLKGESLALFSRSDGTLLQEGDWLKQPELSDSLERIAKHGRKGFYAGETARAIIETLNKGGGIMTEADLAAYKAIWRDPVKGSYKGNTVLSMPPPSSGGIHLVQMLQWLENFPLADWGANSSRTVHIMTEAMKRAYADRSKHLGDPDFSDLPIEELLSEAYGNKVIAQFNPTSPTPSEEVLPATFASKPEGTETSHFSVIDDQGNAVSNTYTLNFSFGSGIVASGTGILLNNQMDDFSAKPGVPNAYKLIGGLANAIEPGKRMLSSMSPTIVLHDGKVRMLTGSPGGSRIITTVLQVLLNYLEHGFNIAEANNLPRFHHQWLPDELRLERTFPAETVRLLEEMGYPILTSDTIGAVQSIVVEDGVYKGASDPRRDGGTAVGY